MDDEAYLKRCSLCRSWKPASSGFYRNGKYRQSRCKLCMKETASERNLAQQSPCPGCGVSIWPQSEMCRSCRHPARTEWTEVEVAWLAGLFEGEGTWTGAVGRPSLAISMTDRDVIERAAALLGGAVNGPYSDGRIAVSGRPYKPAWKTQVGKSATLQVLIPRMWPWLGERRRQQVLAKRPEFLWLDSSDGRATG